MRISLLIGGLPWSKEPGFCTVESISHWLPHRHLLPAKDNSQEKVSGLSHWPQNYPPAAGCVYWVVNRVTQHPHSPAATTRASTAVASLCHLNLAQLSGLHLFSHIFLASFCWLSVSLTGISDFESNNLVSFVRGQISWLQNKSWFNEWMLIARHFPSSEMEKSSRSDKERVKNKMRRLNPLCHGHLLPGVPLFSMPFSCSKSRLTFFTAFQRTWLINCAF